MSVPLGFASTSLITIFMSAEAGVIITVDERIRIAKITRKLVFILDQNNFSNVTVFKCWDISLMCLGLGYYLYCF